MTFKTLAGIAVLKLAVRVFDLLREFKCQSSLKRSFNYLIITVFYKFYFIKACECSEQFRKEVRIRKHQGRF